MAMTCIRLIKEVLLTGCELRGARRLQVTPDERDGPCTWPSRNLEVASYFSLPSFLAVNTSIGASTL